MTIQLAAVGVPTISAAEHKANPSVHHYRGRFDTARQNFYRFTPGMKQNLYATLNSLPKDK